MTRTRNLPVTKRTLYHWATVPMRKKREVEWSAKHKWVNGSPLDKGFIFLWKYSRLSLSRIPRDNLKHFEVSVPRHISVAQVREKINPTTTFNKWICNLTPEVRLYWKYCGKQEKLLLKNIVQKRRNCSSGAISPLFHNILLPVLRIPCKNRDQNFTSIKAVIRDKRGRDNEGRL